jgi:hypothetical protein
MDGRTGWEVSGRTELVLGPATCTGGVTLMFLFSLLLS